MWHSRVGDDLRHPATNDLPRPQGMMRALSLFAAQPSGKLSAQWRAAADDDEHYVYAMAL
jgi:hypothetical protein